MSPKNKKIGRPKSAAPREFFACRLPSEVKGWIRDYAKEWGISEANVLCFVLGLHDDSIRPPPGYNGPEHAPAADPTKPPLPLVRIAGVSQEEIERVVIVPKPARTTDALEIMDQIGGAKVRKLMPAARREVARENRKPILKPGGKIS